VASVSTAVAAGPRAIQERAELASKSKSNDHEVRSPSGRRKVTNIVCRTKYLDDLILRLTGAVPEQHAVLPKLNCHLEHLEKQLQDNSGQSLTGVPKHVQQVLPNCCLHAV
jgi:uncharacterized coiled-coil protein SlyX